MKTFTLISVLLITLLGSSLVEAKEVKGWTVSANREVAVVGNSGGDLIGISAWRDKLSLGLRFNDTKECIEGMTLHVLIAIVGHTYAVTALCDSYGIFNIATAPKFIDQLKYGSFITFGYFINQKLHWNGFTLKGSTYAINTAIATLDNKRKIEKAINYGI